MPIEIISERHRVTTHEYSRAFMNRSDNGLFLFDSDEYGYVDVDALKRDKPEAYDSWKKCMDGTFDVVDQGVWDFGNSYVEPAIGRCDCGAEVVLDDPMTNECEKCGALYNSSGQRLRPESEWEEPWYDLD